MLFSLGGFELIVLVAISIPVALLFCFGDRRYRFGVPLLVCASFAAVVTPADLLSMLILSIAFLMTFLFGAKYSVTRSRTVT